MGPNPTAPAGTLPSRNRIRMPLRIIGFKRVFKPAIVLEFPGGLPSDGERPMQIGCDLIFVQKREHFVLFQFGQGEDRGQGGRARRVPGRPMTA